MVPLRQQASGFFIELERRGSLEPRTRVRWKQIRALLNVNLQYAGLGFFLFGDFDR